MSTPNTAQPRDEETITPPADLPPVRRQRSSIPSFLFISFVLFMLTNNRNDELDIRYQYIDALASLNNQLSNYTAWLHGTTSNFSLPTEHNSTLPLTEHFVTFGALLDHEHSSYYVNLTGFWRGDLQYYNLTGISDSNDSSVIEWQSLSRNYISDTNISAVPEKLGAWNWARSSKLAISIGDRIVPSSPAFVNVSTQVAIVHGKIDLTDDNTSEELRLEFDGVHFISNGSLYAFAEANGQYIDARLIPSLVPEARRNETARVIEAELASRIAKLKERIDTGSIERDSIENNDEGPKTRCSFQLYGQILRSEVSQDALRELEDEIEEPTGISTIKAPPLKLSGVLMSRNCGILYEIKDMSGLKSKSLYRKITTYAGVATLVNLLLLVLLSRQISRSRSATGLSRVSRYPFLVQSLIDAIAFVGHITLAILADGRPALSALAPAGLACMLFVNEAQFAVLIGQIQAPEDVVPPLPTTPLVVIAVPTPGTDDTAQATLPTPIPPAQLLTPVIPARPSFLRFLWHHIRSDPSARLWTLMSFTLIFVFRVVIFLSLPLFFVGSLYCLVWVAQIYRSARKGRSSGLSAEYVIGVTLCRLFFVLYFLGCRTNILDVEPRMWIYGVAAFMFAAVAVILLQEYLGPAFFLPRNMVTEQTYDYHPSLPLPDPESPEQSLGDCAICMDAIHIDPALRDIHTHGQEKRGLLGSMSRSGAKKSYSLAPCHHLFHTACLEQWLAIKNICPQCRRPLPPL